jgi:hypothetical protein
MSWRGMSAAHCPVCHVTLGDDILFDAHRPADAARRRAPSGWSPRVACGGMPVGEPTVTFSAQPPNQDHLT